MQFRCRYPIMTAQFGATYSGLGDILGDLHSGLLDKLLAMPRLAECYPRGPLLQTTIQTVLKSAVILITAFAMGDRPRGGMLGVLTLLWQPRCWGHLRGDLEQPRSHHPGGATLFAVVNLISILSHIPIKHDDVS